MARSKSTRDAHSFWTVLSLLTLMVAGCAPSLEAIRRDLAQGAPGHLISDVPFIPQEQYYCGPASLAMVLSYWGDEVSQEQIASELYLDSIKGTLNFDLEFYARRRGFRARSFAGDLERVKGELRANHPLIVFQDLGIGPYRVPHFAVLLGYDEVRRVVILHSGTTQYRVLPYEEFLRTWERRQRWILLITPKAHD